MQTIEALLISGSQLASGTSQSNPLFNQAGGTIRMQTDAFKKRGFDLEAYFAPAGFKRATLNLSVAPDSFVLGEPRMFAYSLENILWTDQVDWDGNHKPGGERHRPFLENFLLDPVRLTFRGRSYPALLYIPHSHLKPLEAPRSFIEALAPEIPDIHCGDKLSLDYNPAALQIKLGGPRTAPSQNGAVPV